jgi:DNA-binding NtrC family response regulator
VPDPSAHTFKALLVEDEFLIAIAMQELLGKLGYDTVGPARSVDQAIWLIEAHSDLMVAVLDVHLAGERVWPVARELTERGVPFLFVTGDVAIHAQLPADLRQITILPKPFDEIRLEQSIKEILRGNEAQRKTQTRS